MDAKQRLERETVRVCHNRVCVAAGAEPDLGSAAGILRVSASGLFDARLEIMPLDFHRGIGPDEAVVIATYLNPALRSPRTAVAQIVQASVLPNPAGYLQPRLCRGWEHIGMTNAYNFTLAGR